MDAYWSNDGCASDATDPCVVSDVVVSTTFDDFDSTLGVDMASDGALKVHGFGLGVMLFSLQLASYSLYEIIPEYIAF